MCIATDHVDTGDDRTKRYNRRKFSNTKRRNYADADQVIKPIVRATVKQFDNDDPLAGIDLRRVKRLSDLE